MTAPRFVKKPVEVEAERWDGSLSEAYRILAWITANGTGAYHRDGYRDQGPDSIVIQTLEGPITASSGDYIIRGVEGEFYPCKPDIFRKTYDPVD